MKNVTFLLLAMSATLLLLLASALPPRRRSLISKNYIFPKTHSKRFAKNNDAEDPLYSSYPFEYNNNEPISMDSNKYANSLNKEFPKAPKGKQVFKKAHVPCLFSIISCWK
ncbi:hypothetical protein HELRODRAFT_181187 [Helobdella robusta]|uniref:Uncharacterized protein n=1 Tax=Helobdella robusta TaxID=6412 RepID=T1FGQ2_HELRO|nr:hypothetical protein HELRODRAFT_181187 [Helobdella robusta]ESN93247.1 hypothetical protein HELRODRAFT_181187 [Helobdella robusta]